MLGAFPCHLYSDSNRISNTSHVAACPKVSHRSVYHRLVSSFITVTSVIVISFFFLVLELHWPEVPLLCLRQF